MPSKVRTHYRRDAADPDDQINIFDNLDPFEAIYCRDDDEISDSELLIEEHQQRARRPGRPKPKPISKHTPKPGSGLAPQTDQEYMQEMENTKPKSTIVRRFCLLLMVIGITYFLHWISEKYLN